MDEGDKEEQKDHEFVWMDDDDDDDDDDAPPAGSAVLLLWLPEAVVLLAMLLPPPPLLFVLVPFFLLPAAFWLWNVFPNVLLFVFFSVDPRFLADFECAALLKSNMESSPMSKSMVFFCFAYSILFYSILFYSRPFYSDPQIVGWVVLVSISILIPNIYYYDVVVVVQSLKASLVACLAIFYGFLFYYK